MSVSKRLILATVSCFALSLGGCNKKNDADKSTPVGDSTKPAPTTGSTDSSDDMRVRPPTAKDLKRYTKDLTGDGPLVATIETSKGVLHCELFEDGAPITVANFVGLARGLHPFRDVKTHKAVKRPYFDGLTFHRVIPGFMIQGGDPLGVGTGGPGYKFTTEVSPNLKHDRVGILSMANGGKNTNGSQFFIMDGTRSQLDGSYNVFGHCKEADVIKAIASVETKPGGEGSTPVDPPTMNKVTIARGMPQ